MLKLFTMINQSAFFSCSKEKSTNQVVFPIYTDALDEWAKPGSRITSEIVKLSESLPMMKHFGYTRAGFPPVYGEPEPEVKQRAQKLHKNPKFREMFKSLHNKSVTL